MTLPLYRPTIHAPTNHGEAQSSQGTTIIVANRNGAASNGSPTNPYSISNTANVQPLSVPSDGMYLDVFVLGVAAAPAGGPVVNVWGLAPPQLKTATPAWPADITPATWTTSRDGIWIPLIDGSGNFDLTLEDTSGGGTYPWVGLPSSVYLAGVVQVMVLVKTAGSGTQMVGARIVG